MKPREFWIGRRSHGYGDDFVEPMVKFGEKFLVVEKSAYQEAVELIAKLQTTLERRQSSDDVCEHPFDENIDEALELIKKWRQS